MTGVEKQYDDPIWEYVLVTKLQPYVEASKKWWAKADKIHVTGTGVFPVKGDAPPGFMYRMTNTPVRSPIKGVQIFPFVPAAYLLITGVAGGVTKMISRVCANGLEIDGFVIIEKHNLPSTYHQGQFVAFIPKDIYEGTTKLGKFVYLTVSELSALAHSEVVPSVLLKVQRYL